MDPKLLHIAYELVWGVTAEFEAEAALYRQFPAVSKQDIVAALRRAAALRDVSYQLAEALRASALTSEEAHRDQRRRCPGFERLTYDWALANAYFETR